MLNEMVANADLLFLIAVRVLAMIETAPLLSGDGSPQIAKIGLAGFAAVAVYPWVLEEGYPLPVDALGYFGAIVGEALIGIIIGF
ncbi:MAG: flagellar biosynthetic protein FliR, partial [Spirochaetota bacterium]